MSAQRCGSINASRVAHLDLVLELALEATKEDLALAGLEAVDDRRDRTDIVGHREEDQLLVDKVADRDLVDVVVHVRPRL